MTIKTVKQTTEQYGTAAERAAIRTSDIAEGHRIIFRETDTDAIYEFFGTAWVQTHSGGAALVTGAMSGTESQMLTDATGTGTSFSTQLSGSDRLPTECSYLATLGANNTISATATVRVYGARAPMAAASAADKIELATLTLSGTGDTDNDTVVDTDAIAVGSHYYPYIWAEVTAISGTGAKVQCWRIV